jgi:hypothetical protein
MLLYLKHKGTLLIYQSYIHSSINARHNVWISSNLQRNFFISLRLPFCLYWCYFRVRFILSVIHSRKIYYGGRATMTELNGILRQIDDKNIKMILCTLITLKWQFVKSKYEFSYKFYIFWVWSLHISIYVERNLDADRTTE